MEERDQLLIGKQLGTCTLEQLLGAGGMGAVYLAHQQRPARTVAVKVLRAEGGLTINERQEFLIRFRREADVIAQLDHINILPIYEYGEQDGLAYLVMPYLTGGSLRDTLARNGPLSLSQALNYTEQIAAALQYAHEHRIVHRDIKPANILFHADGRLVLADFGIARIMRDAGERVETTLTGPSHFIGSVEYMSPEMVNGSPIDHRTDIYELGIVLFQMLAGRVPFQGTTPFMIAAQHLREQPPSLSQLKPSIPPAVDAVVHKALAKETDARYNSAREMAQALRTAIGSSDNIVQKEPYIAHTPPPAYDSSLDTRPTQSAYSNPYQTIPETPAANIPEYAPLQEPYTYTPDNTSSAYPENAFHRSSTDEPAILPISSPQHAADNPRWPIWVISLCLVVILIAGGLLLGLPTLKDMLGMTGNSSPAIPTSSTSPGLSPTTSTSSTPTPSLQGPELARSVVKSYYAAINRADYQSAYQLWGTNYQNSHPYNQFANGFATTVHDTITLNATTQQADGTYSVAVTLVAINKTSTGTVTTTYSGHYIVGLENGQMKLLTANFQQVS
jgi:serine/threonine protein kinase